MYFVRKLPNSVRAKLETIRRRIKHRHCTRDESEIRVLREIDETHCLTLGLARLAGRSPHLRCASLHRYRLPARPRSSRTGGSPHLGGVKEVIELLVRSQWSSALLTEART